MAVIQKLLIGEEDSMVLLFLGFGVVVFDYFEHFIEI